MRTMQSIIIMRKLVKAMSLREPSGEHIKIIKGGGLQASAEEDSYHGVKGTLWWKLCLSILKSGS